MTTSTLIRNARTTAKFSQRQLAELIGVAQPRISEWESGKVEPGAITLIEILKACKYRELVY